MPISLDDLRKTTSFSRRDKQRYVAPVLIETGEERELAADFCRYFAELAANNKRQRDFSEPYLTERAGGDFKLARGLVTALLGFYSWESETFAERLPTEDYARLQEFGLANPSALRLALYDFVSSGERPGFVNGAERAETLELFAAGTGLEPALLEELLYLDAEENARLRLRTRLDGQPFRPPTPGEVVRRYNRLAVESLLYNATEIIFGFGPLLPGPLVKRIGYYSKEFHIPYDLDYNALGEVQLRLYGPAQAFGPPTKHSERLARLTFITLALARRLASEGGENSANGHDEYSGPRTSLLETPAKKKAARPAPAVSENMLRSALAQVYLRDKVYLFDVAKVAAHLAPANPEVEEELALADEPAGTPPENGERVLREAPAVYSVAARPKEPVRREFDSAVEARFSAEFEALAREGHTAGWQIEREPDAIALPGHNLLFIPDFALRRGQHRVWLEIIGFWTPEYRARKLEKLEKLRQQGGYKLLLAVAQELQADFSEGPHGERRPAPFPAIFYKNSLRATEVVALLQREYDDRAGRIENAAGNRAAAESALLSGGYVAESRLYKLLGVYNRNELLAALERLGSSGRYIEGYGLCSDLYLQAAAAALEDALASEPQLPLDRAAAKLREAGLELETPAIEALVAGLPELEVARPSLFEVYIQREGSGPVLAAPAAPSRSRRKK